jgi:hypothetical protein
LFQEEMADRFPVKVMGPPTKFLGVQFERVSKYEVHLHQQEYTESLIAKFLGPEATSVGSPASKIRLSKYDTLVPEIRKLCMSINGGQLWLARLSRLDISWAVNQNCRKVSTPSRELLQSLKRILRYLKGSLFFRLVYTKQAPEENFYKLGTDGDHAGSEERFSTGGNVNTIGSSIISYFCRTVTCICLSTCESELVFIFFGARTGQYEQKILKFLCPQVLKYPIVISNDNEAAISVCNTGRYTNRTRHIESKYLFTHELVKQGIYVCAHKPGVILEADLLTKPNNPVDHFLKLLNFKGSVLFCIQGYDSGLFPKGRGTRSKD